LGLKTPTLALVIIGCCRAFGGGEVAGDVRATGPGVDDDAIASCCRGKELGTGVASWIGVASRSRVEDAGTGVASRTGVTS
jgi:hypothetical protein